MKKIDEEMIKKRNNAQTILSFSNYKKEIWKISQLRRTSFQNPENKIPTNSKELIYVLKTINFKLSSYVS